MATIDLVLLVILGGFIVMGFMTGLFQALGAVVGIVFGYFMASSFYEPLGDLLSPMVMGNEGMSNVIAFTFIFLLINHLVGIVVWFLAKTFQFLKMVPFFAILNRFTGAVLGFIEGLFVIGVVLNIIDIFLRQPGLSEQIAKSDLAQLMLGTAHILDYIMPTAFKALNTLM